MDLLPVYAIRIPIDFKPFIQCDLACRTIDGKAVALPRKSIIGRIKEDPTCTLGLDRTSYRFTGFILKLSDVSIVEETRRVY